MQKAFSIALIWVLLLPTLNRLSIVIDFEINQDFIAEVLCIKKEEPMTVCNGKCFLTNELKAQDEKEQQQAPNSLKQKLEVFCQEKFSVKSPDFSAMETSTAWSSYAKVFIPSSHLDRIFHPPKYS
ncbi:hypothetical protein GCM10028791_08930 [Echinicola sediminis]